MSTYKNQWVEDLVTHLLAHSQEHSDEEIQTLADNMLRLEDDSIFYMLKELSGNKDLNHRLLLSRRDLFARLRSAYAHYERKQ